MPKNKFPGLYIEIRKQEKVRLTNVSKELDVFATALLQAHGMKRKQSTTLR